ncbi:hypothetical protein [Paenibacillus kandeliae]|uniref:hypothetical protein n=1 Tax=Paenibacillus kandeliae TaxID=3231269 RepID=UPI003458D10E
MDMTAIVSFIKENVYISLLLPLFIWLYKEFKVMVTSEEQSKITTVENKLKMYARLEAQIAYVGHYPTPDAQKELFHQLAEIRLHMGESAQMMIRDYYRTTDIEMVKMLIPLITVEMNKLKKKKDKLVPEEAFGGLFEPVRKLFKPLKPMVILTIWILLSVVIGFRPKSLGKKNQILCLFSFITVS